MLPLTHYSNPTCGSDFEGQVSTTIAILAVSQLGQVVLDGNPASLLNASAILTLLVGAILVLASFLRLGLDQICKPARRKPSRRPSTR
jgi:sulfate permease, SulP family